MNTLIQDGRSSNTARVSSDGRLYSVSVTESEAIHANDEGQAYNLNTGEVALGTGESGFMYIKNNSDTPLIIESVIIGIGSGGTHSATSKPKVRMYRNPTTGTLISGAGAMAINENRNFGSSNELNATVYQGVSGSTVTNGDVAVFLYATEGGRSVYPINLALPKGTTIAISVDPNLASGTVNVYGAIICHEHSIFND
jgi:hypothetical protein